MKVEISFTIQPTAIPSHHTDRRFSKVFDVDWPGRPMPEEEIDLDVSPPVEGMTFKVAGVYWSVERPCLVYLERIEVAPDQVEWQDGLDGYVESCRRRGWQVFP